MSEFCEVCGAEEVAGGFTFGLVDVELCSECLRWVAEGVEVGGGPGGLAMLEQVRRERAKQRAAELAVARATEGVRSPGRRL